jgi:hypothetical protein
MVRFRNPVSGERANAVAARSDKAVRTLSMTKRQDNISGVEQPLLWLPARFDYLDPSIVAYAPAR